MKFYSPEDIYSNLTYKDCIPVMREAMKALSSGQTNQMLRNILPLGGGNMFGIMAGTLGQGQAFGSKLISVSSNRADKAKSSHQGVIVLFGADSLMPLCQAEAGAVTAIRTASASAMATDYLAKDTASVLAIIGTGEQAYHHCKAMIDVRPITDIRIWGRDVKKAAALAEKLHQELGLNVAPYETTRQATYGSDIVCTVTASAQPVVMAEDIAPGTHLNIVGSSYDGPREIDDELVRISRFFVDSKASVEQQGAEYRHALSTGVIKAGHIQAEIGEVVAGNKAGRIAEDEITIYKSLGHIVQDVAAVEYLHKLMDA